MYYFILFLLMYFFWKNLLIPHLNTYKYIKILQRSHLEFIKPYL
jgi:hypothetical protein